MADDHQAKLRQRLADSIGGLKDLDQLREKHRNMIRKLKKRMELADKCIREDISTYSTSDSDDDYGMNTLEQEPCVKIRDSTDILRLRNHLASAHRDSGCFSVTSDTSSNRSTAAPTPVQGLSTSLQHGILRNRLSPLSNMLSEDEGFSDAGSRKASVTSSTSPCTVLPLTSPIRAAVPQVQYRKPSVPIDDGSSTPTICYRSSFSTVRPGTISVHGTPPGRRTSTALPNVVVDGSLTLPRSSKRASMVIIDSSDIDSADATPCNSLGRGTHNYTKILPVSPSPSSVSYVLPPICSKDRLKDLPTIVKQGDVKVHPPITISRSCCNYGTDSLKSRKSRCKTWHESESL